MGDSRSIKESIKRVVTELMNEKNIEEITVKEIVLLAGISRSTFYRMYSSVDDLIKDLEQDILENLRDLARYSISAPLDLQDLNKPDPIYLKFFEYLYDERDFYIAITSTHGDLQYRYKENKLLKEIYGSKIFYMDLKCEHPDFYMKFAIAGHDSVLDYWLRERPDVSCEDFCVLMQKLMFSIYLY